MMPQVGDESAGRSPTGSDHPESLPSKERPWDVMSLLLGHLPLRPCGPGSLLGKSLAFFLPSFPAPSIREVMEPICQGHKHIEECGREEMKLLGWPALLTGDDEGLVS